MVNQNSSVTVAMMVVIANMKCQIQQFYLEQFFIQQKQEKISDIYISIYLNILHLRFIILERKDIKHSMLDTPENNNINIHNYY